VHHLGGRSRCDPQPCGQVGDPVAVAGVGGAQRHRLVWGEPPLGQRLGPAAPHLVRGVQQQLADVRIRPRGLTVTAWPRSHVPTLSLVPHNEVTSLPCYLGTVSTMLRYHLERRCSCERIRPPASTPTTPRSSPPTPSPGGGSPRCSGRTPARSP